ncbi:MAG: hypothetical protein CME21_00235 [Gemmatimonadetes bacterium]|jgi:hypothetical protein|nr:hypothetical protein [Gemmatimonadota bacterium]|tara:strand:- start:266 stop:520 length:255 start_codon:yes stop_codon:yes gene_type:complete
MTEADDTLNFDINDLTIAEIVEIEELTGMPFDAMGDSSKPKGKMLQALAFITKRRADPSFTYEQAGALKINLDSGDADPTDGDE